MCRKHITGCLFLVALLALPSQGLSVKKEPPQEDTAHISLQKTATASQKTKTYRVKKGDSILKILQQQSGVFSHRYTKIKELNPALQSLDVIYPGQVLILPAGEAPAETKEKEAGGTYRIRKGDSLTRIIIRKFNPDAAAILNITKQIQRLNPKIANLDRIYPGQVLVLPGREEAEDGGEEAATVAEAPATAATVGTPEAPAAAGPPEDTVPSAADAGVEEITPPVPEKRLAAVSHVIRQMDGNVIATGSYFIPIPEAGRVAIDCTVIPVAELNDGSTILMDFAGRLPESLRKVIQANWKNYSLVRLSPREDTAATLQKIIGASQEYAMAKWGKPLSIGTNSRIQVTPDWLITRKNPPGAGSLYRQGLFFLNDEAQPLPRSFVRYAGKNGLIITEITAGTGIVDKGDEPAALPAVPLISGPSPLDTAFNLLAFLGHQADREAEVTIFETAKDGFNLTIKAGLLLHDGDRRVLFHAKKLPPQFLDILKEGKTEVILLGENEPGRTVVEKTLRALNIPFAPGTFSFTLPGKTDRASATLSFPALKAETSRGLLYLINFALDRDIRELLRSRWGAEIVRY